MENLYVKIFFLSCLLLVTKGVEIVGGAPFDVYINGKETRLTIAEAEVAAAYDTMTLVDAENKAFTIGPTWAFFGLSEDREYRIDEWAVGGSCGCVSQICGVNCDSSQDAEVCKTAVIPQDILHEVPFICLPWMPGNSFCYTLHRISNGTKYKSHMIYHVETISLTSYGGPDNGAAKPGYTIKQSKSPVDYAWNAKIVSTTPWSLNPLANFRYVEHAARIISHSDLLSLLERPELEVNLGHSVCEWGGKAIFDTSPMKIQTLANTSVSRVGFEAFFIMNSPKVKELRSLSGQKILGLKSVLPWNEGEPSFDIVDPCNKQFLTLRKNAQGYYADIPGNQTLKNNSICVAISEAGEPTRTHLALYEFKVGTSIFIASTQFQGALSVDYVKDMTLRITTKSSFHFGVREAKVDVQVNDEVKPMILKLKTSIPLTCQLHISDNCILNGKTTQNDQTINVQVPENCGYWHEISTFNCEGIQGDFHPPATLTKVPLNVFIETKSPDLLTGGRRAPPNLPNLPDNPSWWVRFFQFFRDFDWNQAWQFVINLLQFVVVIGFLGIITWYCVIPCCLRSCALRHSHKGFQQVLQEPKSEEEMKHEHSEIEMT